VSGHGLAGFHAYEARFYPERRHEHASALAASMVFSAIWCVFSFGGN